MNTEILYANNMAQLDRAAHLIREGKLVAFPTETVYGLGGNALLPFAAERIYIAKGRPSDNPLIVHLSDASEVINYAFPNETFWNLAEKFMPGPLTIILPKRDCIPSSVTGGLDTVAIRVPAHPFANLLIQKSGVPIAAPSANLSGKPSPTKAEHVIADLYGRIDAILISDPSEIGVESTIVSINSSGMITLLRPGAVTYEMLQSVSCGPIAIDPAILEKNDRRPLAPGMKYRHYAPHMPVYIVDAQDSLFYQYVNQKENCGVLCYEEDLPYIQAKKCCSLGSKNSPKEQAYRLFDCLREMDANQKIDCVYARMPEKSEVGLAVWNRLIKAAGFHVISLLKKEGEE